jgi:hypothetical protein
MNPRTTMLVLVLVVCLCLSSAAGAVAFFFLNDDDKDKSPAPAPAPDGSAPPAPSAAPGSVPSPPKEDDPKTPTRVRNPGRKTPSNTPAGATPAGATPSPSPFAAEKAKIDAAAKEANALLSKYNSLLSEVTSSVKYKSLNDTNKSNFQSSLYTTENSSAIDEISRVQNEFASNTSDAPLAEKQTLFIEHLTVKMRIHYASLIHAVAQVYNVVSPARTRLLEKITSAYAAMDSTEKSIWPSGKMIATPITDAIRQQANNSGQRSSEMMQEAEALVLLVRGTSPVPAPLTGLLSTDAYKPIASEAAPGKCIQPGLILNSLVNCNPSDNALKWKVGNNGHVTNQKEVDQCLASNTTTFNGRTGVGFDKCNENHQNQKWTQDERGRLIQGDNCLTYYDVPHFTTLEKCASPIPNNQKWKNV